LLAWSLAWAFTWSLAWVFAWITYDFRYIQSALCVIAYVAVALLHMGCNSCGRSLNDLPRALTRKFCCSAHRYEARDAKRKADFWHWWEAGQAIKHSDPERALLALAPIGAVYYRLSCPAPDGSTRTFPRVGGWRLRPFEPPHVPLKGVYVATFEGFKPGVLHEGGMIAIGQVDSAVNIGLGEKSYKKLHKK